MNKEDLKISQADFDKTKVSRLSDRPNVGYGYGGRALSAQELKERYDASAVLIREHFNALIDALAGVDENGERIPGVADLIMTGIAAGYSLGDLFSGLGDGSAMQYIKAGIENYSVKGYLQYLATRLADKLEGSRIEATAQMLENGKAPTVSVRMDGQGEDKTVRFDFGIPEGKEGKEGPQGIPGEKGENGDPGIVELADELGDSESMALSQKATTRELKNIKNDSSNALKGTATGEAVRMEDVSPVAHEMAVKVRSKNLCPIASIDTTSNATGYINLTGFGHGIYTLSADITKYEDDDATNTRIGLNIVYMDGTSDQFAGSKDASCGECDGVTRRKSVTATTNPQKEIKHIALRLLDYSSTTTRNAKAENILLETGETATEYTPYIEDVSTVKVLKFGKNLIDLTNWVNSSTKATYTIDGDSLRIDKSVSGNAPSVLYDLGRCNQFSGKKLTVSCILTDIGGAETNNNAAMQLVIGNPFVSASSTITLYSLTVYQIDAGSANSSTVVIPHDEADRHLYLRVYPTKATSAGDYAVFSNIQVEAGDTATEYEPYIEPTEHAVNADGTAAGVTSLSPTTTLMTDVEGAIIDVEYNRDLNKAFDELKNAILALGGNV